MTRPELSTGVRTLFLALACIPVFLPLAGAAYGHGMSEADKHAIMTGENLQYLKIGATHMLSGLDHLLFIFGIVFVLTRFRDIVKYITAFTVGHSITLIAATFMGIRINYFLIDAVIALSVCYIAFANMDGFKKVLNVTAPNMLAMIFGLGLVHGLGLSTRLQQLPLNNDHLLMNIISFNAGVEIGQIFALALMLALIVAFRKSRYFTVFSQVSNFLLILAGGALFLMQMHGYEHSLETKGTTVAAAPLQKAGAADKPHNKAAAAANANRTDSQKWKDVISVTIPASSDKEYKFFLAKGAQLDYDWKTDGQNLFFDFHGEPAGDSSGYFKRFKKGTSARANGTLVTEFAGTHGWYWKNRGLQPVTITLKASGDYERMDK